MDIRESYDPERFRRDGHRVIDAIADAMARWQRREGPVLPWVTPADARTRWQLGTGELVEDLSRVLASSTALEHPRYMAHQVPPPLPAAVLAEAVSAILNNGMAVFEMGPAAVPIELEVVGWMCKKLGYGDGAGGVMTSGGSLGNLTAMLAMRQARAGYDAWQRGTHGGPPLAVVTSNEAHYSVARTLRIMGWGEAGAIAAPVDAHHRLTGAAIERALAQAGDLRVIGIVAAAGSTATGAFDPLDELADVAAQHGLWLHVDAAHGGGLALSERHRWRLKGIERADSVVWDAHKLMMMPALVTGVLFRNAADAHRAFAQEASYLFDQANWWDLGQKTLECTKRMMALEVWCALRVYGEAWFGAVVDRLIELAQIMADKIARSRDFQLVIEPEANIVCFRRRGVDNRALRQRVVEAGKFYVVGTVLDGEYCLRSTIMNPLTEPHDFDELLDHLCHV